MNLLKHSSIIILFILILYSRTAFPALQSISPNLDIMRESIVSCVLKISDKYFFKTGTLTMALPSVSFRNHTVPVVLDRILLKAIFKHSAWSLYTKKASNDSNFFSVIEKTDNYIIYVRRSIDIAPTLKFLKLSAWNPHARFIIITTTLLKYPLELVTIISKTLWHFHVLNAIILIPREGATSILDIYTWFPFDLGHCGKHFDRSIIINSCTNGKMNNTLSLFPKKVPLNMNGCPVIVRTVLWPPFVIPPPNMDRNIVGINFTEGIEIKLMNTLAEVMNFEIIYTISVEKEDWGDLFRNGSATGGLLKELIEERVDIGLASLAATENRIMFLDYTASYTQETITWCVPTADLEPKWLSIIQILKLHTWLVTIFTFSIIVLLIWRISLASLVESTTFKHLGSCYLYMFCVSLGISIKKLPNQFYVRIVFLMWIIYSLHLCVAFQTSLMSRLTQPDYETQITTLQEVFAEKIPFGYLPGIRIYFDDMSNPLSKKVQQEGELCFDVEECLRRIATDRDFALALPRQHLLYVSGKYLTKDGQSILYWFKSNAVSYPVQMFAYKGYPLIGRIDELILRMKSGGFIIKWLSDVTIKNYNSQIQNATDVYSRDEQVLTIAHLQGAFAILIFGLIAALISFIGEITYYKFKLDTIN